MKTLKIIYSAIIVATALVDPVNAKSLSRQIDEMSPQSAQPAEFVERDVSRFLRLGGPATQAHKVRERIRH